MLTASAILSIWRLNNAQTIPNAAADAHRLLLACGSSTAGILRQQVHGAAAAAESNGYDDFVKARQSLAGNSDAYSATNLDQLQAVVSKNAESLRLVKLGLGKSVFSLWPASKPMPAPNCRPSASCKLLVQLLGANRRLAELEGRTNDAVTICVETIKFGNEISRGGEMIYRLVGISCEAIGCEPLIRLVPAISPAEAHRVAADLEGIVAGEVRWADVIEIILG